MAPGDPSSWVIRKPSIFRPKRLPPPPPPSSTISEAANKSILRRSASLKSYAASHRAKRSSSSTLTSPQAPEKRSASSQSMHPPITLLNSSRGRRSLDSGNREEESLAPPATPKAEPKTLMIAVAPAAATSRKEEYPRPVTSHSQISSSTTLVNGPLGLPTPLPALPTANLQSPNAIYSHIVDTVSKRVATFDFLRKTGSPVGRDLWWFQTLRYNKSDLSKVPYFNPQKLARRASNFLLLGISLPVVVDLNSSNPTEYLRALNTLFAEFESYQTVHSPDGPPASSLSRARIPQIFKRAASHAVSHSTGTVGKGRRTSSAAESGLPTDGSASTNPLSTQLGPGSKSHHAPSFTVPTSSHDLLAGEEYTLLLTPSLPFGPDFYETFATLCDTLIDVYSRLLGLISSPDVLGKPELTGGGNIAELFASADKKIRRLIVQGITKDFEERSKEGVRSEMAGVGRLVLGGLM